MYLAEIVPHQVLAKQVEAGHVKFLVLSDINVHIPIFVSSVLAIDLNLVLIALNITLAIELAPELFISYLVV